MKNLIALFGLVLCVVCANTAAGQTDTVYLNKRGKITTAENGRNYIVATRLSNGYYEGDRFNRKGRLLSKGQYASIHDSVVENGYFVHYDSLGSKSSEGNMAMGKLNGAWRYYYVGTDKLWYECNYEHGRMVGELRNYYPSGKLKRIEKHNGDISEPPTGKSYAEDGMEITYTPFQVMPSPPFDVSNYLSGIMRYPKEARKKNIEGRVIVQFAVTEEGDIAEARIIKEAHPILGDEALRVIEAMPKWKAGTLDGRPVKIYYNLPLSFKID